MENLNLQKLDRNGVKTLVNWAREEGWNPGEHDFDVFWKTDPDGFYGFYIDGNLVAGGAVISYGGAFGFMGLFIVHPDYRGKGIGKKLWYMRRDLLIGRLKTGAAIGMDGVVAMQPFYEKGGFKIAFRDERYECIGQDAVVSDKVSPIEENDFIKILNYDVQCFGFKRPAFLQNWLNVPESKSFKYMREGNLYGYAVIRKVNSGFKIGPLFADDAEVAEELYKACLKNAVGQLVYLDIPVINKKAVALVHRYKAKYVFECARMYHGAIPKNDLGKVFGITTFELG
ncbi:MAG: GNAT family N-acetyltransferase [Bacteroidota bacterium]